MLEFTFISAVLTVAESGSKLDSRSVEVDVPVLFCRSVLFAAASGAAECCFSSSSTRSRKYRSRRTVDSTIDTMPTTAGIEYTVILAPAYVFTSLKIEFLLKFFYPTAYLHLDLFCVFQVQLLAHRSRPRNKMCCFSATLFNCKVFFFTASSSQIPIPYTFW